MILPRILGCFTIIAFFGRGVMGSIIVRNGVVFALALFLVPVMDPIFRGQEILPLTLLALAVKEAAIGFLIGFSLNIPFLVIESVGSLIDNQRGASIMSSLNFLSGSESSTLGILFTQGAVVIFMVSGTFALFLKGFYQSYSLWPIVNYWPTFPLSGASYFFKQFSLILTMTLLLSAPIIIASFLSEWGLALVSRFAPQLNVFFLAMSIKSAITFLVLSLYFAAMMNHHQTMFEGVAYLSRTTLELIR